MGSGGDRDEAVTRLTQVGNVVRRYVAGQEHWARVLGEVDFAVEELEAFVLAQFDGGLPRGLDSSAVNDFNEEGRHGWD